jgi:hypothetical protein
VFPDVFGGHPEKSKLAQQPLIFIVRADPKPKETSIIKGRQGAETRPRPHRPEIVLDPFEGERFQAGLLFPMSKILARDFLGIRRQAIETRPKFRQSA